MEQTQIMTRILVVDDEPSILHGLALGLTSKGMVIDCVSSGEAAIRKGREQVYDVLIVDISLPDMHGLNVFRELKGKNPQLISIVITAQFSRESVAEARNLGIDDYFEKPFHVQSIRDAIVRGIEQRATERD